MNENETMRQGQGRREDASVSPRYDAAMRDKALEEAAKMVEVARRQREAAVKLENGESEDGQR